MMHNLQFLPIELQASVQELRDAGVGEPVIANFVTRMLSALEAKSNKIQVDVWQIEESLGKKIDRIGEKLQSDIQTQHGATNEMLVELMSTQQLMRPDVQEALAGIATIKKHWTQLDSWRAQVDTWRGMLDTRLEGMSGTVADHGAQLSVHTEQLLALTTGQAAHTEQIAALKTEQLLLRRDIRTLADQFAHNAEELRRLHEEHGGVS